MGVVWEGCGFDVVLVEPFPGFFEGCEECVDAKVDGGFFVEGGELRFPEGAEFGLAEGVEPVRDGVADGAGLIRDEGLAGEDFGGSAAVVVVPVGELAAHEDPLCSEEGVGFL